MLHTLSEEINEFHRKIRARALLVAIEWAGSADKLARMAGYARHAGAKWLQRGHLPPLAALSLSRIGGFPLGFDEMCPGVDVRTLHTKLQCPRCFAYINPPRTRTGCSPLLKRRSEAVARKAAERSPKPNRKPKPL